MTFDLRAQLLIDLGNWQRGLTKANKQAEGFGKSMKTISNGVKAAWAGVAALGIGALYDGIVEVTKAAAEDNRSMALLNEQMRRTWKGNSQLNKSIDQQIDAMSNATGIADDKLRPALIRIAAVTKTPAKGMKFLSLATDIAAKSGQDLNLVSRNVAKFLGGNKTALDKLVPGLSSAGDRMKFLTKNYEGFAVISGRNDPFGRITVVIDNFKEKLGKAFLPMANNVADWLAGPEAQAAMDDIAKRVQDAFKWVNSAEGKKTIHEWFVNAQKLVGEVVKIVDGLAAFLNLFNTSRNPNNIGDRTGAGNGRRNGDGTDARYFGVGPVAPSVRDAAPTYGQTTINVYGTVSGNEVVTALTAYARGKGIPLSKLLK